MIRNKVENILASQPETRNSDKKLLLAVWEQQGLVLSHTQRQTFLDKCATAESVTRARRLLKVKYPAKAVVTEQRFKLFEQYRDSRGEHL